jgi:hypothetical protein
MQAVLYGPTGLPLNPQTAVVVDPTAAAMRATLKPMEYQYPGALGGHYRLALPLTGGLTGIGSGGIILGFRWNPTTPGLLAVLKRISASAATRTTAGSTAFALAFDAVKVTGYSVQHSSGGAAVAFAASQKMRSSMGNSQAAVYYSNGATVISGGTGVADTLAFGVWQFDEQPVTTGVIRMGTPGDIYKDDTQAAHAMVFGPNEGFYIRFAAAQGTSAVNDAVVNIEWAEVLQY